MEATKSGFFVAGSSKEEALLGTKETMSDDGGVGLGLRMQQEASNSKEPSCTKKPMFMSHLYHHDQDSSSCGSGNDVGGSMLCIRSNVVNPVIAGSGDIYDVVGDSVAMTRSLQQPFSSGSSFTFNSSEMTPSMNVNVRVPFTASQWQELERQTMIYKCMMASIPIPPELLLPISRTQPNSPISQSNAMVKGTLELGISGCNSDPEPWRCKRTDGKKWRCSRDVAPDQKYCERHSHKSRPRSRKPVELHTDSMTSNNYYASNTSLRNQNTQCPSQSSCHFSMIPSAVPSAAPSYDQPRSLEWFLKGETGPVAGNSNQEWQLMGRENIKFNDKDYDMQALYKSEEHHLNPNSYMNLGGSSSLSLQAQRLNDHCNLLSSPKTTSLEAALNRGPIQAQETRHFLDMWSAAVRDSIDAGIGDKSPVGSSGERILPVSSLTLSMSGGSETDEDIENGQMSSTDLRPRWMSHGGSWMNSPPGGPLAEALCLGISSSPKSASSVASPHGSSSDNTFNRS